MKGHARTVLLLAGALHFLHDGFADVVYVLLPVWASELGLALWQVGAIRTCYSGGMAAFQLPAGLLAERWGERRLLAAGTAMTALGFVVAGGTGGFLSLLAVLLGAGLGSGVQHPLSSSLVSKAFEVRGRRAALGTYNFSGDLGKMIVPAVVALAVTAVGWRGAVAGYGVVGLAAAVAIAVALGHMAVGQARPGGEMAAAGESARSSGERFGWGIRDARGFQALSAIGMIDNATRSGLLTFLPFVLIGKGLGVAGVGGALALVFAGGALGKFTCGVIAERVGIIRTVILTEVATSAGVLLVLGAPLPVALTLLLPLGLALNGTSSVLYASVADLVTAERRSRAYGLYYTLTIGASALGPTLYGIIGDAVGTIAALVMLSVVILVTVPLSLILRPALAAPARA